MRRLLKGNSKVIYLTVLIYIIYSLQGVLYSSGSFISQMLMLLYIVIGVTHFVMTFLKIKYNLPILMALLFVLLNIFYYVFNGEVANDLAYQQTKGVLACFTPFIVAFYYTYKGEFNEAIFTPLSVILFGVYLLSFNRLNDILMEDIGVSEAIVNNVSYSFTRIIPLLFYSNSNILIALAFLLLINFFIILGAKRGAAVSAVISDMGYFIYLLKNPHKSSIINKLIILFLVIAFMFGVFYVLDSNNFLMERFLEGDLSDRDSIYRDIWNWWTSPDTKPINFLFGGGIASSANITGGSLAHNDWLEVVSNFGLLGGIVYGVLLISITVNVLSTKIYRDKISGIVVVVMWWVTSFSSTWYNTLDNFPVMLLLGYLMGRNYTQCQGKNALASFIN